MPTDGYDPELTRQKLQESADKMAAYQAKLRGITIKEYKNEWQRKFLCDQIIRYENGMQKAIKHEDYEQAALIRDFIKHLKKGNSPWSGRHIKKHIKDFYQY